MGALNTMRDTSIHSYKLLSAGELRLKEENFNYADYVNIV